MAIQYSRDRRRAWRVILATEQEFPISLEEAHALICMGYPVMP